MGDIIKEDINDMTFFDRNMLGFKKEYDLKLYNQKKIEGYNLDEYLKYCLKKRRKKTRRRRKKRSKKKKKKYKK